MVWWWLGPPHFLECVPPESCTIPLPAYIHSKHKHDTNIKASLITWQRQFQTQTSEMALRNQNTSHIFKSRGLAASGANRVRCERFWRQNDGRRLFTSFMAG